MSILRFPPSSPFVLRTVIALAAMALTAWLQWWPTPPAARAADEWLRDNFIRLHAVATPEQRILVVDIDESSLGRYPWPWPRARLAELVENVLADGARGVALDILQEKPADAGGDARMAMLSQHGALVVAQLFDLAARDQPVRGGQLSGGIPSGGPGAAPVAHGYIANHAGLALAAHSGNIGVVPDADGTLRHVPMFTYFEGRRYPTLSRALLDCCGARAPSAPTHEGSVRIPYTRSWGAYTVAKAADVLDRTVPAELIAGRLVLIGSSSLSIGDRLSTPLDPSSAGLLVHASMLTSLLDAQSGLAPAAWPGKLMALLFSVAVTLLAGYAFPRRSAALNVGLLAISALLWLALAYAISPHDPDFSTAAPLLTILFLLAIAVPFHWQLTQQKSRQLIGTLRQYVATAVVDELLRSNLRDPLAPRQLEVTTLIADMEGYTSHVEALPVEEAARLTTAFLDCLTRPVLARMGTLDKYTGDGLVAFWGAPLPNADHADLALDAAHDIVRAVRELSDSRQRAGQSALRVRIGIESGLAMAGNYGTAQRSIYTAVGDSVNTASRLEQAARDFPHDIIIGAGTVGHARRHRFLALGERLLRGKEKALQLYTLEQQS